MSIERDDLAQLIQDRLEQYGCPDSYMENEISWWMSLIPDVRPEVRAFAETMEEELRAGANIPGISSGTQRGDWLSLLNILNFRSDTLEDVIDAYIHEDPVCPEGVTEIREAAADVGNVAMMLADTCGALET